MNFKKLSTLALALVLIFGCAGEDQLYYKKEKLSFGKVGGKCLTNFANTIDDYVNGKLIDAQISAFWSCVSDSVSMFGTFINGKVSEHYTAKELQRFLNTFFMNDGSRISDELMDSIMLLKQVFIGGEHTSLTKAELDRSVEIIEILRAHTLSARPYINLYSFKGDMVSAQSEFRKDELLEAVSVIREIATDFGNLLQNNQVSYRFEDFKRFLELIDGEVKPQRMGGNDFIEFVPISAAIKSIFVGPDIEKIHGGEWSRFFDVVGELFGIGLKLYYFAGSEDWYVAKNFQHVNDSVAEALELLEGGLSINSGRITYDKIHELISRIDSIAELPLGITANDIELIVEAFIEHVLKPWTLRDLRNQEGFDDLAFRTLSNEYLRWAATQKYINNKYTDEKVEYDDQLLQDDLFDPITELNGVIDLPIALNQNEDGRLLLSHQSRNAKYDHKSFTQVNWQRAVSRLLIKGYVTDPDKRRAVTGLTLEEYLKAFYEFADVVIALDILRPLDGDNGEFRAVEKFANESFVEAALFLTSSNGDRVFELKDGMQYINYVQTGITAANELFTKVVDECKRLKKHNIKCNLEYKNPEDTGSEVIGVDTGLFRSLFDAHTDQLFSHMPEMHAYYSAQSATKKKEILKLMETAIGNIEKRTDSGIFPVSETVRLVVVMQYVETFFVVFDKNIDGMLTYDESSIAFPRFKDYLQEVSEDIDSEKRAESMFYYLINEGTVPSTLWEKAKYFLEWESKPEKWPTSKGDRFRVMQILAALQIENEKKQ